MERPGLFRGLNQSVDATLDLSPYLQGTQW